MQAIVFRPNLAGIACNIVSGCVHYPSRISRKKLRTSSETPGAIRAQQVKPSSLSSTHTLPYYHHPCCATILRTGYPQPNVPLMMSPPTTRYTNDTLKPPLPRDAIHHSQTHLGTHTPVPNTPNLPPPQLKPPQPHPPPPPPLPPHIHRPHRPRHLRRRSRFVPASGSGKILFPLARADAFRRGGLVVVEGRGVFEGGDERLVGGEGFAAIGEFGGAARRVGGGGGGLDWGWVVVVVGDVLGGGGVGGLVVGLV